MHVARSEWKSQVAVCFPTLARLGRAHGDSGESNTRGGEEMDAVGRAGVLVEDGR